MLSISLRNLAPNQSNMSLYAVSQLFLSAWITIMATAFTRSSLTLAALAVAEQKRDFDTATYGQ